MTIGTTPLRTIDEARAACQELADLQQHYVVKGSPEADRRDLLRLLIAAFGTEQARAFKGDPIDLIQLHMTSCKLKQADLAHLIGSRSRASELLHRRRRMTMDQIHVLHIEWRLPIEVLIRPYEVGYESTKWRE